MKNMKRKIADLSDWTSLMEKTYTQMTIEEPEFQGYVTKVRFDRVKEPIRYRIGEYDDYFIVNDGYCWLQYFPIDAGYALTTMIDKAGQLVQHYFDINTGNGLTPEGVPYFDDLFLDLVVLPNGEQFILDEDELYEALENGVIGTRLFKYAKREMAALLERVTDHEAQLLNRWKTDIKLL